MTQATVTVIRPPFPFFEHRTMEEVQETERLIERLHATHNGGLSGAEVSRLRDLANRVPYRREA